MKTIVIYLAFCTSLILGCNEVKNSKADSRNEGDSAIKKEEQSNRSDTNHAFEVKYYLSIHRITSGPVYWDDKKSKNFFFRVIQIPEEEHLQLLIEKISMGGEGSNYQLIKRYWLDEAKLSLSKFDLLNLDSLVFKDSVTITGLFNDIKYEVNMENIKVKKK